MNYQILANEKMDREKISVVIPMYNASQTIEQCLESILNQTYKGNYEIIVINDGSKDNSLSIVEGFIEKNNLFNIRIIDQVNSGVASARNAGLNAATGNYVAFLDSDDKWLPNKIQIQVDYLLAHPDVDMVAGVFGDDKIDILKSMEGENIITMKAQIFKNYFSPPTVIFRKSILPKSGLFDPQMKHAEDGLFFNNMVYYGKCVLLNQKIAEPLTNKERWGDSGLSGNLLKMEQGELFNIWQAYKNQYIDLFIYLCATCFSIIKFIRRVFIKSIRKILSSK